MTKFLIFFILVSTLFNLNAQDSLDVAFPPISFNTENEKIALVYYDQELTRKDTFDIDPNKTVQYLKEALQRHYKITVPKAWSERIGGGGYSIESNFLADHEVLYRDEQTLAEAGVKAYDVVEFDYYLMQRAVMACNVRDIVIQINGLDIVEGAIPVLILGDQSTSKETIVFQGVYQFSFDFTSLCNPDGWVVTVVIGDNKYYLANPKLDEFDTSFPSTLKLQFDMPKMED